MPLRIRPWAIPSTNDRHLRDAVKRALRELVEAGEYAKILEQWGV